MKKKFTWLLVALGVCGAAACSKTPNRMPKGFEKLKLGVSTKDALDTVLSDDRWRDHVQLRVATVTMHKKLGYAKDTKSALAQLAEGAGELRERAKDRHGVPSVDPQILIEGAAPFQSVDLKFKYGTLTSITFSSPYNAETYDGFLSQAKSQFGAKCEPSTSSSVCESEGCEWSFCDEHVAYNVEKILCNDDSSMVFIELRQNDCPTDSK